MPDPGGRRVVFNRHAAPDMPWGRTRLIAALDISFHERTTLRQYLENMPIRRFHDVEHLVDECCGNSLVEQVTHGIYKDHAWAFPRQWLGKALRPQR